MKTSLTVIVKAFQYVRFWELLRFIARVLSLFVRFVHIWQIPWNFVWLS